MKQNKSLTIWYFVVATVVITLSTVESSHAEDKNISKIYYANCGAYTVSKQWVHWKADGQKHKKEFHRSLAKKQYTCFNLDDMGSIPDGAEVWLSIAIDLGDKEGCRKDNTKFYKETGSTGQVVYTTRGQTLTNNRCKISDGTACINYLEDGRLKCVNKGAHNILDEDG